MENGDLLQAAREQAAKKVKNRYCKDFIAFVWVVFVVVECFI